MLTREVSQRGLAKEGRAVVTQDMLKEIGAAFVEEFESRGSVLILVVAHDDHRPTWANGDDVVKVGNQTIVRSRVTGRYKSISLRRYLKQIKSLALLLICHASEGDLY
jgi:hypothetical protein